MKISDARKLMKELKEKHNLTNWTFEFDRSLSRFGCCDHKHQIISLSKKLVKLNTEEQVKNTLLHEIAHALVGIGYGHNNHWERKAVSIGCSGTRCYDDSVIVPKEKYIGICPNCKKESFANRLTARRKRSACGKCCNGRYNPAYILNWKLNK